MHRSTGSGAVADEEGYSQAEVVDEGRGKTRWGMSREASQFMSRFMSWIMRRIDRLSCLPGEVEVRIEPETKEILINTCENTWRLL
jgi:hypothetical protein